VTELTAAIPGRCSPFTDASGEHRPSRASERGILAVLLVAVALAAWLAAWRGAFWVGAMSMAVMMAGVLVVEGVRAGLAPSAGVSRRVLATRMVAGRQTVVVSGDRNPDRDGGSGHDLDFLRPPPLPCGGW
jgi:predicted phage tail protein